MVATTTAALIAAGIGAAGGVGGAALSSSANKRASKYQAESTNQALAYEREKEAARKAEYDQRASVYQKQFDDWQKSRNAILAKYGVSIPGAGAPAGAAPGGSRITRAFGSTQGALGATPQGPRGAMAPQTIGTLMGSRTPSQSPALGQTQPVQPRTIGDLAQSDPFDWKRYGVGA